VFKLGGNNEYLSYWFPDDIEFGCGGTLIKDTEKGHKVYLLVTGKVATFHAWIAYVGKDRIHHRMKRLFQSKKKSVLLIYSIVIFSMLEARQPWIPWIY